MSSHEKKKRRRVLIVDDHPAVRDALAMRIGCQADLQVVGEAADTSEALRVLSETQPTWLSSISRLSLVVVSI